MTDGDQTNTKLRVFFSYTAEAGDWCNPFAEYLVAQLSNRHQLDIDVTNWLEESVPPGDVIEEWSLSNARDAQIFIAFITEKYLEKIAFKELVEFHERSKNLCRLIPLFLHRSAWKEWKDNPKNEIPEDLQKAILGRKWGTFFDGDNEIPFYSTIAHDPRRRQTITTAISSEIKKIANVIAADAQQLDDRLERRDAELCFVLGHPDSDFDALVDNERKLLFNLLSEDANEEAYSAENGWQKTGEVQKKNREILRKASEGKNCQVVQVMDGELANSWKDDLDEPCDRINFLLSTKSEKGRLCAPLFWLPKCVAPAPFDASSDEAKKQGLRHVTAEEQADEIKRILGISSNGGLALLLQYTRDDDRLGWAATTFPREVLSDEDVDEHWYDSWVSQKDLIRNIRAYSRDRNRILLVAANDVSVREAGTGKDRVSAPSERELNDMLKREISTALTPWEAAIRKGLESIDPANRPGICRLTFLFSKHDAVISRHIEIPRYNTRWPALHVRPSDGGFEMEEEDKIIFRDAFEQAKREVGQA